MRWVNNATYFQLYFLFVFESIYNQEDDEEYNMDVDEKEYYNLKATTTDNKVRNSFFCDRENQEGNNQFTGKFGDDDNRETEEDLNVYEHRPTPTSYEQSYREKKTYLNFENIIIE